jgi:hypothetical protein
MPRNYEQQKARKQKTGTGIDIRNSVRFGII